MNLIMKTFSTATIAFAFSAILAGPSRAATADDILNDIHEANRAEIHMGLLAEQKGGPATQDYGKTLVADHRAADKKVLKVAEKEGITIKKASDGLMMKMEMKKLSMDSGPAFDKAFADEMIDDHKKNIDKLQKAQADTLPADVHDLIGDILPTLQTHLQIAQKISDQAAAH